MYSLLEMIFKLIVLHAGITHWSMFLAGGFLFVAIGAMNEFVPLNTPLMLQGMIGSVIITVTELLFGLYFNVHLGIGIWDYSGFPMNLCGQICLPYSLLWILLAIAAVILNDWLGFWLFGEQRPHYRLF